MYPYEARALRPPLTTIFVPLLAPCRSYECWKDLGGGWWSEGIAENIHWFQNWPLQRAARAAVPSWMDSPGHRENILGLDYDRLGVGVAASRNGDVIYAVQNFC